MGCGVSKKLINSLAFEIATALRASQLSPVEQATINENLSLSSRGAKRRGDLFTWPFSTV